MDFTPIHVGSVVGTILIVLGFIALLTQRTYIDSGTNAPSEIELPILGKLKANYPALIFVFLGCAVVVFGLTQYKTAGDLRWLIDGRITSDSSGLNWQKGQLVVFPSKINSLVKPGTGEFVIELEIPNGKTPEEAIERIQYSHPNGSMVLIPKKEFEDKSAGKPSRLIEVTPKTRRYITHLESMPSPN